VSLPVLTRISQTELQNLLRCPITLRKDARGFWAVSVPVEARTHSREVLAAHSLNGTPMALEGDPAPAWKARSCGPPRWKTTPYRRGAGGDPDPWGENAVRAMEDGE
jgi:hypothetical protein